tara:strand:+ start:3070 stop:3852 length:783 start_codon:yes stop_codon:yes gene_type:complete
MITVILTSRVQDNKDSNMDNLLTSLQTCGANEDNCEVLIKYDSDDELQLDESYFSKFSFSVKKFVWSRGEGRHSFHLDHFYLFSQRNLKSRFILLCADDFTFTKKNFIDDILNNEEEYCFVGPHRPRVELYKGCWRQPSVMEVWKHNEGVSLPCVSARCIEVLQNYGWQCNGDNWITLLTILMYEKFGIDMWKTIPSFYTRNPTDGASGYGKSYNNMEMDGSRNPENPYYFKLVEQQAKNLYLNIIADKLIKKQRETNEK